MMKFETFCETIREAVGYEYENVEIRTINKNNGLEKKAIVIREEENSVTPTIYLEEFFESFSNGESIESIVSEIRKVYEKNKRPKLSFDIENFSCIEKSLRLKLVNANENKELLHQIPWIPFAEDLAIVAYVIADLGVNGTGTVLVKNNMLQIWGISKEQLFEIAQDNTPEPVIKTMEEIIRGILEKRNIPVPDDMPPFGVGMPEMYVISNAEMLYGAIGITNKAALERHFKGKHLLILPSSVHEAIAIVNDDEPTEEEIVRFTEMIRSVNAEEVAPEDVLSDHPYIMAPEAYMSAKVS